MSFRERERNRLIEIRDAVFKDPGSGLFFGKPRDFVLNDAALNLWDGIRWDAIAYFKNKGIKWWQGTDDGPTGHLLSSQIACVNHLYFLRQRADLATAALRTIDVNVTKALVVDDGYVEFEFIGEKQYLKERSFTRGANCTSVDAFMIGLMPDGQQRAFLIEWKYTEDYDQEDKYIAQRAGVYDDLIRHEGSPFKQIEPKALYLEPFYQLMRQTLLGWQFSENCDHGCTSYRHVHVIPDSNVEFHSKVTSPFLNGKNVSEAWRSTLKEPHLYIRTTPENFIRTSLAAGPDSKSIEVYLTQRYWSAGVAL
jgi:hypothetical protein